MNTTEEELPLIVGSDNIIKRAYDELNRFAWTDEELRAYESIDMKQAAEKAILEGAIEKGKIEEKIEIAKNLLLLKLSLKDIAIATGLSESEIKKLGDRA